MALSSFRFCSTSAEKPPLKLVAEIRKLTEVSITKTRDALAASKAEQRCISCTQVASPSLARRKPLKSHIGLQARVSSAHPSSRAEQAHLRAACAPPSSNSTARPTLWRVMHSSDDVAICLMVMSSSLSHTLLGKGFWLIQAPRWWCFTGLPACVIIHDPPPPPPPLPPGELPDALVSCILVKPLRNFPTPRLLPSCQR